MLVVSVYLLTCNCALCEKYVSNDTDVQIHHVHVPVLVVEVFSGCARKWAFVLRLARQSYVRRCHAHSVDKTATDQSAHHIRQQQLSAVYLMLTCIIQFFRVDASCTVCVYVIIYVSVAIFITCLAFTSFLFDSVIRVITADPICSPSRHHCFTL